MTRAEFNDAADTYCALFAASTTSGQRTIKHNKAVGGVANSAHLYFLARDVVYDAPPDQAVRIEAGRRLGLRVIVEGDHDHLQPWDWQAG
jgi:hypothetical protein